MCDQGPYQGRTVTLDGKPAIVSLNGRFYVVRTLDGQTQAEYSWNAVYRIFNRIGRVGEFQS